MIIFIALLFIVVSINSLFTVLIYYTLSDILDITQIQQAASYKEALGKSKRPTLPYRKDIVKGRSVTPADELVDIADIPWEDGYKAMEHLDG